MVARLDPRSAIHDDHRGRSSMATGTVALALPSRAFDPSRSDSRELREAWQTLAHETIHHLHSFTTAFLFMYAENVRGCALGFKSWLSNPSRDEQELSQLVARLRSLEASIKTCTNGCSAATYDCVTAQDLYEGVAVVEAARTVFSDQQLLGSTLEPLFVSQPTAYGRILAIMLRQIGPEPLIRLTSTLCYLALNTENPCQAFRRVVTELSALPYSQVCQLSSADIMDHFVPDRSTTLLARFARGEKCSEFKLWNRVAIAFATAANFDEIEKAVVEPSALLTQVQDSPIGNEESIEYALPLLTYFSDGSGDINVLVRSIPDGPLALLMLDELVGLLYRTARLPEGQRRNYCDHVTCPAHEWDLCQLAYPPGRSRTWHECGFRQRFAEMTNIELEDFAVAMRLERLA